MDITAMLEHLRKNGISPEKSYFECPVCEDRGYTATRSATGELVTRICPCQIRKDNQRRIARSGLSGLLESCTLDTYQTAEPWQKQAKQMAEAYITDWRGKWFMPVGPPAAGKRTCARRSAGS